MTRKHFQELADAISRMDLSDEQRRQVASEVARVCKMDNPRFDRTRFLQASGVKEGF